MVMFVWGASLYFQITTPPSNAMEIYVVGKRWMWKAQHVSGQREINELHVPVGQPVKLIIGSEDVLHAYWVPAFRMKMDAVPGRTTTMWFEAAKPGEYQLFCAEYCGMSHSRMIGKVTAMDPGAFQTWLAGGKPTGSMAEMGAKVFTDLGCATCHVEGGRGPSLRGVFGAPVTLANGEKVTADEGYIRESILTPTAKMVAGFPPLMPTFQGVVSEEQIAQLTAYVKTLANAPARPEAGTPAAAPGAGGAGAAPAPGVTPQAAGH
jgi:cytochrome c oxidase subunit 2